MLQHGQQLRHSVGFPTLLCSVPATCSGAAAPSAGPAGAMVPAAPACSDYDRVGLNGKTREGAEAVIDRLDHGHGGINI